MEFTKIEYQIIEFLSMHPGQVFDKERIYAQVCGYDAEGGQQNDNGISTAYKEKNKRIIQKKNTQKLYGGLDTDGKNKKLVAEKNNSALSCDQLNGSISVIWIYSSFLQEICKNKIWEKYINYADYTDVFQQYGKKYEIEISRPNQSQMNRLDYHLSEMCDFMETYSVLYFFDCWECCCGISFFIN